MNVDKVVAAFQHELRTRTWPGETLGPTPQTTRRSRGAGGAEVTAHALDEGNVDAAIREERAHFERLGQSFEWKAFSFDRPPDLVARLAAAGFEIGEREAIVVIDLADGLEPFEGEFGGEVRRIDRVEDLDDFRTVAEAAFEKDYAPTTNELAEALRAGGRGHDAYVATIEAVPASVGRLYTHPESLFAGLYGGGTRPEFRRRGLYRAVVAARARDAAAVGARYLLVDALPTSLPILLKMGFTPIADTWPCTSPQG